MRTSGILMPVFSLPSPYGIGCFSGEAEGFIDKLAAAGQRYWQVLPLGRTGGWYSPYQPLSCFALDPMFIDPRTLFEKGLLTKEDIDYLAEEAAKTDSTAIEYETLIPVRHEVFKKAYTAFCQNNGSDEAFEAFRAANEYWLADYALFASLAAEFEAADWSEWPEDIKKSDSEAVALWREKLADEIRFFEWLQYEADSQWQSIRAYAHERNVEIIGDIPIYAAFESADCWSHPDLFKLTEGLRPSSVAGCPPDAFSETGQIWGNPLYRWKYHARSGFGWWIQRLKRDFDLYDVIRLDHMRGFESYYSIPADAEDALGGKWIKGPGMSFFRAVKRAIPGAKFIAEDLGYITPKVNRLKKRAKLPGMKVLQFAFDSDGANPYLPENYKDSCVVYTGTHDNDTTAGWYKELVPDMKKRVTAYLRRSAGAVEEKSTKAPVFDPKTAAISLVSLAFRSKADICIIPLQDHLLLGSEGRVNTPGTVGPNWRWRMKEGAFTDDIADYVLELTKESGRLARR